MHFNVHHTKSEWRLCENVKCVRGALMSDEARLCTRECVLCEYVCVSVCADRPYHILRVLIGVGDDVALLVEQLERDGDRLVHLGGGCVRGVDAVADHRYALVGGDRPVAELSRAPRAGEAGVGLEGDVEVRVSGNGARRQH